MIQPDSLRVDLQLKCDFSGEDPPSSPSAQTSESYQQSQRTQGTYPENMSFYTLSNAFPSFLPETQPSQPVTQLSFRPLN